MKGDATLATATLRKPSRASERPPSLDVGLWAYFRSIGLGKAL